MLKVGNILKDHVQLWPKIASSRHNSSWSHATYTSPVEAPKEHIKTVLKMGELAVPSITKNYVHRLIG